MRETEYANKRLIQQYIEQVWNGHQPDQALEYYTSDSVLFDAGTPLPAKGHQEQLAWLARIFTAFPDLHVEILTQIAENNRVVTCGRATGTHLGAFADYSPTGRLISFHGCRIDTVQENKIVETSLIWDTASVLRQLGVIPAPQPAGEPL